MYGWREPQLGVTSMIRIGVIDEMGHRVRNLGTRVAVASVVVCGLMALAAGAALGDAPPTLSVSLNKLPANAGYTVTALLSAPSTLDCTAGDPTNATYPDLSWSQTSTTVGSADEFTGPLDSPANDTTATSCAATTWTTPPTDPFGTATGHYRPGTWYFQVAVYCLLDGTDPDCATGVHNTNVVSLVVPPVGGGPGSPGPGGGSGSGGSSGSRPCAGLRGQAASQCQIKQTYDRARAACATQLGKQAASCRKAASLKFRRQFALLKCQSKTGKQKAACIRRADSLTA
jgi:hypothetical protein